MKPPLQITIHQESPHGVSHGDVVPTRRETSITNCNPSWKAPNFTRRRHPDSSWNLHYKSAKASGLRACRGWVTITGQYWSILVTGYWQRGKPDPSPTPPRGSGPGCRSSPADQKNVLPLDVCKKNIWGVAILQPGVFIHQQSAARSRFPKIASMISLLFETPDRQK